MTWGKVDDKLHSSPKWRATSKGARALWTTALSWSMDQLTDGEIPKQLLPMLEGTRGEAASLVASGLWEITENGWQFHDWHEYQPTRESVLALRRSGAERQKVARSPELRQSIRDRDGDYCRYCSVEVHWTDRRGPFGGTYDHVDPLGESTLDNLVVCCRGCNAAKSRRTPEQAGMRLIPAPGSRSGSRSGLVSTSVPTRPDPTRTTGARLSVVSGETSSSSSGSVTRGWVDGDE